MAGGSEGQKSIGRVAGWAIHFDRLLADPTGHAAFAVSVYTVFIFSSFLWSLLLIVHRLQKN